MSQDELVSHQASYNDLFCKLLDATFLIDKEDLTVLEVNPTAEQFVSEEMMTKKFNIMDLFLEEDTKKAMKSLRMAKRKYYPVQFEYGWKDLNGKLVEMQISACMLKISDDFEVLQLIAHDVTDLNEAQRKNKQLMNQLEALSVTDEMTQLSNYRRFKELIEGEHSRAQRYKAPYAVIFCDVDNFKHYNDTQGHPAGDEVLRGVAKVLRENTREQDIPARYGGEEFVVLCPGVNSHQAKALAERLRQKIEEYPFLHREKQPLGCLSISIGVSSYPEDAATHETVLEAADEAVYYSKENGRNRVTMHHELKVKELKKA